MFVCALFVEEIALNCVFFFQTKTIASLTANVQRFITQVVVPWLRRRRLLPTAGVQKIGLLCAHFPRVGAPKHVCVCVCVSSQCACSSFGFWEFFSFEGIVGDKTGERHVARTANLFFFVVFDAIVEWRKEGKRKPQPHMRLVCCQIRTSAKRLAMARGYFTPACATRRKSTRKRNNECDWEHVWTARRRLWIFGLVPGSVPWYSRILSLFFFNRRAFFFSFCLRRRMCLKFWFFFVIPFFLSLMLVLASCWLIWSRVRFDEQTKKKNKIVSKF